LSAQTTTVSPPGPIATLGAVAGNANTFGAVLTGE
jgi:hypothetical protein